MARPRISDRAAYTPEALAEIAMQVFDARGYEATRMEHIARAANITKSSLYHHVSGKEELLRIALVNATEYMFSHLERPEATEGPAMDRILFILRSVVLTDLKYIREAKLLFGPLGESPMAEYVISVRRQFLAVMTDLVREAQRDGALDGSVDPRMLARLFLGLANSPVGWYRADGSWRANEIADATIRLIESFRTQPALG